jgi:hypothetical protein
MHVMSSLAYTSRRSTEWHVAEGHEFEPIKYIATVRGKVSYLLIGKHIALNIMAYSHDAVALLSCVCVVWSSFHGQGLTLLTYVVYHGIVHSPSSFIMQGGHQGIIRSDAQTIASPDESVTGISLIMIPL